jgi:predicted aconitase
MELSREEEQILKGEQGWVKARALQLLITLGELNQASKLVSIQRSQVAGVSYKTAGDATLELIQNLAQENVSAQGIATQNPAGMDLTRWREMGIKPDFASKQLQICDAYQRLGIKSTCTCTPYLSGNCPLRNEIVGFSESSAVAYVNSVIGARTNRHGGLDALSAALVGKVPLMGYLLDENRQGTVQIDVKATLKNYADYAALGYQVGKILSHQEVPIYNGLHGATKDQLKILGAASAASGSVALYHVLGVTPEALDWHKKSSAQKRLEHHEINDGTLHSIYEELSASTKIDLIAIGCPHASLTEIQQVVTLLKDRKVKSDLDFWVFTSPQIYAQAEKQGYSAIIRGAGADIFQHTCMVVMPIEDLGFQSVAVNSAKAAFYIPRMTRGRCRASLRPLNSLKTFLK